MEFSYFKLSLSQFERYLLQYPLRFIASNDMFQSAQKIKRYTKDLDFHRFLLEDKTMDAVDWLDTIVDNNKVS